MTKIKLRGTTRYGNFEKELCFLINRFSLENDTDTPDFVLTQIMMQALYAYTDAVSVRKEWHRSKTISNDI